MKLLVPALALLALLAAGMAEAKNAGEEPAAWSHLVRFRIPPDVGEGLVQVELPPAVFHHARPDLADRRIIGPDGSEVPHAVRLARGRLERERREAHLYNHTHVPGRQASVNVDLGRPVMKDRIRIETSGTDFRRKVLVEGSPDGRRWSVLREGAFIISARGREGHQDYELDEINLPRNDYRHLRVTVYNDQHDPDRIAIESVVLWQITREPPQTKPVPVRAVEVSYSEDRRWQHVDLDLGYRHLPLHQVRAEFEDANFFRRVAVTGRNRTTRTVPRPREDAAPVMQTVEEPWHPVGRGALFRYAVGEDVDESLTLDLAGAPYRFVRISIHNQDNPPLGLVGTEVTRFRGFLELPARAPGEYTLYLGRPDAQPPRYDLAHYVEKLRDEGLTSVTAGQVTDNPAHLAPEAAPPAERFSWLVWIALLAALFVLGLLVRRASRQAQGRAPAEDHRP